MIFAIAILTLLAAALSASASVVAQFVGDWIVETQGEYTVYLPVRNTPRDRQADQRKISAIAEAFPGVATVRFMDRAEVSALLEPWVDLESPHFRDFPLPGVVRLIRKGRETIEEEPLRQELEAAVPGARLDVHRDWIHRITQSGALLVATVVGVAMLTVLATILVTIFATRSVFGSHRQIIDVLRDCGAPDSYISNEFQRFFLIVGGIGAGVGGTLAIGFFAALMGVVANAPEQLDTADGITRELLVGAGFACGVALIIASSCAVTSRVTVGRVLARGLTT